jgi:hypothetical protein
LFIAAPYPAACQSSNEMSESGLPPLQPYLPTTFLERGVAVPFTTPQLFGARTRPGRVRGIELIVPNPSGGRGVYVLDWTRARDFFHPTVHDRRLVAEVTKLSHITPRAIRQVANQVAAEGMAGEQAMHAAIAAIAAEKDAMLAGNYVLLMALVDQLGLQPEADGGGNSPAALERVAQRAVANIAADMGQSKTWVAETLEALTGVLRDVGLRSQCGTARVRRVLALLQNVRDEIRAWCATAANGPLAAYGEMIGSVASLTIKLTTGMLQDIDMMTDSTVDLLAAWAKDSQRITRAAVRPEWLVDGWEPICLLWRQATNPAAQRAAMAEIAVLVPVLPKEAFDWAGMIFDDDQILRFRRLVPLNEDWRTGATVFELIARNEALRAAGVPAR